MLTVIKILLGRQTVQEFLKFVVVGLVNLAIDAGLYFVLTRFFWVNLVLAKGVSASIAIINSFVWNRSWTFKARDQKVVSQFYKFTIVQVIGLGLNVGAFALAVKVLHLPELISFMLMVVMVTFWNFSLNKRWAFKS